MYAVIQQGVKENSTCPLRSKSLRRSAASPRARRGWTVVPPPSRKPSTSLLPASLLSAATSATTRGKSASSSMSISTRKTSASWAGNPALSRKAIAFSLSLRLRADADCTHRLRLWRVKPRVQTPRRQPHAALMNFVSSISRELSQLSILDRVLGSMRPRIVIYALASLLLLAFHAPFRALAFLISDIRDPRPLQRTAR